MEKSSKDKDAQLNKVMMDSAKWEISGKRSPEDKKMISGTFLPARPSYQGDFTKKWKEVHPDV